MTANNQTISYLGRRFAEAGVRLNPRHGQNFLVDLNLLRLITERADLSSSDVVLEVGTGTGSLTSLIAPRAGAVVTVEIDTQLHQLASEELFGLENVVMLRQDALRNKSNLDTRVIEAVQEQLSAESGRALKLVANLPFSVATPVMANLLLSPIVPRSMTVTVQREVADRLTGRPNTKDYGALSVWMQSQCTVETVRNLPPSVFWPRPKVNSAIIHVEVQNALRNRIGDLSFFHDFVRSLFFHRRKFLRSVLYSAWKNRLSKSVIDEIIALSGMDPQCRADQLCVEAILDFSEQFRRALMEAPAH